MEVYDITSIIDFLQVLIKFWFGTRSPQGTEHDSHRSRFQYIRDQYSKHGLWTQCFNPAYPSTSFKSVIAIQLHPRRQRFLPLNELNYRYCRKLSDPSGWFQIARVYFEAAVLKQISHICYIRPTNSYVARVRTNEFSAIFYANLSRVRVSGPREAGNQPVVTERQETSRWSLRGREQPV